MRKILLALAATLLLQEAFAANPVIVTGTWNRGNTSKVALYRIISGRIETLATYNLQSDHKFGFAFDVPVEGFYVLGDDNSFSSVNKYPFYFKPGDKLAVAVNDSTYTLPAGNTPENVALAKWHDKVYKLEQKAVYFSSRYGRDNGKPSTYVDFFPLLEKVAGEAKSYRPKTPNAKFDKAFADFRQYDLLRYAFALVFTPRTAHPQLADFPSFYRDYDIAALTATTSMLDYPFGSDLLSNCVMIRARVEGKENWMSIGLDNILSQVGNDALKGELVVKYAVRNKTYDGFMDYTAQYGKYVVTPDQKERMEAMLVKIARERPKTTTIDFAGTDPDGKKVALSDLKGKVVLIDVWATWCGPCKGEIPHLKKLEEQYHGKNVVFMSISVDEVKDLQKWKDFVKNEGLTGLQLFGGNGWKSDVAKFYNITGIPRFMLVDKAGNMVTDDAPRPSNPELKTMIDKYLAQ